MDADLQHEPETAPLVALPVLQNDADFSVGSRNVEHGTVEDWPVVRRLISWGATALARPLSAKCKDPMSGFFSLNRGVFEKSKDSLNPLGCVCCCFFCALSHLAHSSALRYKIGLEILVRSGTDRVIEVPIQFKDRIAGESKLTMKTNVLYVQHLWRLYRFKFPKATAFASLTVLFAICVALYVLSILIRL